MADPYREITPQRSPCPYCGLSDHTGRDHMKFVMSLSLGGFPEEAVGDQDE